MKCDKTSIVRLASLNVGLNTQHEADVIFRLAVASQIVAERAPLSISLYNHIASHTVSDFNHVGSGFLDFVPSPPARHLYVPFCDYSNLLVR